MPDGKFLLLNAAGLAGPEKELSELNQGKWWVDTENFIREHLGSDTGSLQRPHVCGRFFLFFDFCVILVFMAF